MRFKAILADIARKRYPLSILILAVGVLVVPFTYLLFRFGLELTDGWWPFLSIGIGVIAGCAMVGLGSLVEDIHDISMHTMGYDLELGEPEEPEYEEEPVAPEAEAQGEAEAPAEQSEP